MTELADRLTRAFHREGVEVLGHYLPSGRAVVFNPLQTRNPDPLATLVHEGVHRYLTCNSYFGVFLQALALFAQRGLYRDEFAACLDAARATQEGIATWVELAMLADRDVHAFRDSLEQLPADYRDYFDTVSDVVPIRPGHGIQDNKSALVMSLGLSAQMTDVLLHDIDHWQKPGVLAAYLREHGPDVRLRRILALIKGSDVLDSCLARLELLPGDASDEGNRARRDVVVDLHLEFELGPDHSREQVRELMQQFAGRCAAHATAAGLQISFAGIVPEIFFKHQTAEVRYVDDWEERYPHALAGEGLTTTELRSRLGHAARNGLGMALALAMYKLTDVHVGTQFYLSDDAGRMTSAEKSMALLEQLPVSQGELPLPDVLAAFAEHRLRSTTFYFIRESWRVWDYVLEDVPASLRPTPTYEGAMEVEITESGLASLVEFRDIGRSRRFAAFSVAAAHDQFAAVFFDPRKPRTFSLQSVPGEFGGQVLMSIIGPWGFEQRPVDELGETFEIVRLLARSFLL